MRPLQGQDVILIPTIAAYAVHFSTLSLTAQHRRVAQAIT